MAGMNQYIIAQLGFAACVAVCFVMAGCSQGSDAQDEASHEHSHAEDAHEHAAAEGSSERAEVAGEHAEGEGEHGEARESHGEHGEAGHDEEGEESGVYIGRSETWDVVRRGARVVLSFDAVSNAFVGSVENTTTQTLCAVRVEVHLSTGTELGPTPRNDLPAGQTTDVRLPTAGEAFESWTAHPEMSACSGG